MFKITQDTKLYISCSSRPGNFGATVYNFLFDKYKINALYLPRFCVNPRELISAIKLLNCSGCSISMPLKNSILPYLDSLSSSAEFTGSVNTIVNDDGKLVGHNTDISGVKNVLRLHSIESAVIYGSGSVVDSISVALRSLNINKVSIYSRNFNEARLKAKKHNLSLIEDIHKIPDEFDILINATPVDFDSSIEELYRRSKSVFDLSVQPCKSHLMRLCDVNGKLGIGGIEMAKFQLQFQFALYTGVKPTLEEISLALNSYK